MSPLCQTHIAPDQLNQMEPFYPLHAYVCDAVLPGAAAGVRRARRDLHASTPTSRRTPTSWVEHARRYVETWSSSASGSGAAAKVVEIASNDGYLLQHFVAAGIPVLGIEPAANVAEVAVEKGMPTHGRSSSARERAARDRARARHGRPAARQQRAGARARPQRLRRRA